LLRTLLLQVCINLGILLAYCAGVPYEQGFTGFDVLGGNVWLAWWRVMLCLALLPAVLQVGVGVGSDSEGMLLCRDPT
jgi:hypothetical protein